MNRRDFSLQTASLGVGLGGLGLMASTAAQAQGPAIEGKEFEKVSPPVAVASPGKIDVIEFFWYGCPHCNALEPMLEAWVHRLPADVAFRRVPVGFTPMHEFHQKLFYALEVTGQFEALHRKVFSTFHVEHKRIDKDADVMAFMSAQGLDGTKLVEAMKSFTVAGKARQAKQLVAAYHLSGVPTLGIHGRFITSAQMTGGAERCFVVADQLIAQARKQGA
jgi:thiol:disulfide interchange protein DsbA